MPPAKPWPLQRVVHQVPGDNQCLRCCIATIFDLPLDEVPFFGGRVALDDEANSDGSFGRDQEKELREWLRDRGLDLRNIHRNEKDDRFYYASGLHGLVIANGPTVRGTYHSVVYRIPLWGEETSIEERASWERTGNIGLLVHDPHPSGAGLLKVEYYTHFIVIDPRRLRRPA